METQPQLERDDGGNKFTATAAPPPPPTEDDREWGNNGGGSRGLGCLIGLAFFALTVFGIYRFIEWWK